MKTSKITKRQLLFLLLTLLWMGIIFWFSAHNGDDSSAQSNGIVEILLQYLFPSHGEWSTASQKAFIETATLLVRKAAHATEYMILCMLLLGCQSWRYSLRRTFLTAWILTVCYAGSDELHQYFVPDRACKLTDVMIDGFGAALGLLIICLIRRSRKSLKH